MQHNLLYDKIHKLNRTKSSLVTFVRVALVLTICLHSERAQTVDERQHSSLCHFFTGMKKGAIPVDRAGKKESSVQKMELLTDFWCKVKCSVGIL
jgi:hypothetical protein